jgi:hypothetical protein
MEKLVHGSESPLDGPTPLTSLIQRQEFLKLFLSNFTFSKTEKQFKILDEMGIILAA